MAPTATSVRIAVVPSVSAENVREPLVTASGAVRQVIRDHIVTVSVYCIGGCKTGYQGSQCDSVYW